MKSTIPNRFAFFKGFQNNTDFVICHHYKDHYLIGYLDSITEKGVVLRDCHYLKFTTSHSISEILTGNFERYSFSVAKSSESLAEYETKHVYQPSFNAQAKFMNRIRLKTKYEFLTNGLFAGEERLESISTTNKSYIK